MESSYGIMTKRQEYFISFQRKLTSNGQYNFATTKEVSNGDIASHISNSDRTITEIQINDLQKAIIGEPTPSGLSVRFFSPASARLWRVR